MTLIEDRRRGLGDLRTLAEVADQPARAAPRPPVGRAAAEVAPASLRFEALAPVRPSAARGRLRRGEPHRVGGARQPGDARVADPRGRAPAGSASRGSNRRRRGGPRRARPAAARPARGARLLGGGRHRAVGSSSRGRQEPPAGVVRPRGRGARGRSRSNGGQAPGPRRLRPRGRARRRNRLTLARPSGPEARGAAGRYRDPQWNAGLDPARLRVTVPESVRIRDFR